MKTILVVAAETSVRATVAAAFRIHCDEFSLLTVAEAPEALVVLETRKVDLMITAPRARELDDFQLLAYLLNRRPRVPVMVMSSRKKSRRLAASVPFQISYLPMSLEGDEWISQVRGCLEKRMRERRPGVTLLGLLQVLHQERATCRVLVHAGERRGKLYLLSGELVHARYGRTEGDEALFEVLSWQAPRVLLLEQPRDLKQTLSLRTSKLLALLATAAGKAPPGGSPPMRQKSLPQTYEPPPGRGTFKAARQARPWTDHANHRLSWWDKKPTSRWRWWAVPEKPKGE